MNFFKGKKIKPQPIPPQPVPRHMDEINKVYQELCSRAGQLQYKIMADKESLDQLNAAIKNVNYEADARIKLDNEAKAKAQVAEQDKQAQESKNVK